MGITNLALNHWDNIKKMENIEPRNNEPWEQWTSGRSQIDYSDFHISHLDETSILSNVMENNIIFVVWQ